MFEIKLNGVKPPMSTIQQAAFRKRWPYLHEYNQAVDFNVSPSTDKWVGILLHHTDVGGRDLMNSKLYSKDFLQRISQAMVSWLTKKDKTYASSHFVVHRDGKISMLVNPDEDAAWHAGVSSFYNSYSRKWEGNTCNKSWIGVEIVGDGNFTAYTSDQYEALGSLSSDLMDKYKHIQPRNITGHENVAPFRKVDPGVKFDWRLLFEKIYSHRTSKVTQTVL